MSTYRSSGSTAAGAPAATSAEVSAAVVATAADVVSTNADVITTAADVVSTNADVVSTGADVVLTNADVVLAEADKVQTGLDRIAVAADLVLTNQDTIDTAADLVLTNADVVSTAADAVSTAADVITTAANVGHQKTLTALTDAAATLTGAQLKGGLFTITPTVARIQTTDTATAIIAAMTSSVDDDTFEFTITNKAAFDVTLAAGTGVTFEGSVRVNKGQATWIVRRLTSSTVALIRKGSEVSLSDINNRNLLINSRGQINQRGYVSATATSGTNEYTVDRWRVVASGQNLAFTTTAGTSVFTAPAGGVEQEIEGNNILSGTYVISFTGTATCTVDTVTKISGDTFTLTGGTNATVKFSSGTFSLAQIEQGDVASDFEVRSEASELILCMRYYWEYVSGTAKIIGLGTYFTTTDDRGFLQFPARMRITPALELATGADYYRIEVAGTSTEVTDFTLLQASDSATGLRPASAKTSTAGFCYFILTNHASARIAFDAEI